MDIYQDEFETDISAAAVVLARMENTAEEYAKALTTIADLKSENQRLRDELSACAQELNDEEAENERLKAENERLQNQVIALRDYMDSRAGHPGKKDGISHLDIFLGLNPEYK